MARRVEPNVNRAPRMTVPQAGALIRHRQTSLARLGFPTVMQFLRRLLNRLLKPLIAKQDLLLLRLDDVAGSLGRTLKASWHDQTTRSDDLKVMLEAEHRVAADGADVVVAGLHAMRADVDALTEWGSTASLARLRSGELGAVDAMGGEG